MTDRFHLQWDPKIGAGSIMNALLLIGAVVAGWTALQYRMAAYEEQQARYEERFSEHGERIGMLESLQVTLAELVIQQQHVMEETARIESRVENRLIRMESELDRLRMRIREIEVRGGD